MGVLSGIDKNIKVFDFFEELSNIPRGSGNIDAVSDYLVDFAKKRNLEYVQEDCKNVIIRKPATPGYEHIAPVMLQSHIDMVCEKNDDKEHDFLKDPLKLIIKDDYIYADKTTLGADNGVGVAYMLAVLDDKTLKAPMVEAIFTVDEETTMLGAYMLEPEHIKSKYMINIDSDEEGVILQGCAGGCSSLFTINASSIDAPKNTKPMRLAVTGLKGGHSGGEIDKNRGNSNLLMGRLLNVLRENNIEFYIAEINGGKKNNVIPRECICLIAIEAAKTELAKSVLSKYAQVIKQQLKGIDDNFVFTADEAAALKKCFDEKSTNQILDIILLAGNGVMQMSLDMPGLVETSSNLGVINTDKDKVLFSILSRSSIESALMDIVSKHKALSRLVGCDYENEKFYPGWRFNPDSKLAKISANVYKKMYKKAPRIEAIHAGVECGIILKKAPELDIISLGANLYDIHTPDEHMSISSVIRTYHYITGILEAMKDI